MQHCRSQLEPSGSRSSPGAIGAPHAQGARVWVEDAESRGVEVFIAAAGMAAALPGVVAAHTTRPVLGVPMESKLAGGLDSLLSMVQMPGGIPVGVLAVGKAGAVNAAILAAQILGRSHPGFDEAIRTHREAKAAELLADPGS